MRNIYHSGTGSHAKRIWSDRFGKHGACDRKHFVRYWFSHKGLHNKPGGYTVGRIYRDVSSTFMLKILVEVT